MNIVIDTNILISALIKDSTTRKILFESEMEFYYPDVSLKELQKHEKMILEKSGMTEEEYSKVLDDILLRVNIVQMELFKDKLWEASNLIGNIDADDVVFLAVALWINGFVWSEDKDFEKQNKIKILKTKDLL